VENRNYTVFHPLSLFPVLPDIWASLTQNDTNSCSAAEPNFK